MECRPMRALNLGINKKTIVIAGELVGMEMEEEY